MASSKKEYLSGYRLVAPRWASTALSGEGARKYGGRWNSVGNSLVYLGGSRALAALELLVHLTTPSSRAKHYQFIEVKVPRELLKSMSEAELPSGWRTSPAERNTTRYGDRWISSAESLALRVPSVLIPEEWNVLLNPEHADFREIEVSEPKDFRFDPRLYS